MLGVMRLGIAVGLVVSVLAVPAASAGTCYDLFGGNCDTVKELKDLPFRTAEDIEKSVRDVRRAAVGAVHDSACDALAVTGTGACFGA